MYFDPKTNKFPYPEDTGSHYLHVKKNRGIIFDDKYPYVDNSKSFKFKRFWFRFFSFIIAYPIDWIRIGLKIKGRKNLKIYKDVIKQGVVSVSNHVHMWDYMTLMSVVLPYHPHVLVWAPNINGENGKLIRMSGGIPIPENNYRATMTYFKAVEKLLKEDHGWLQIYAEGSMWEFYAPIRPFKRGACFFAAQFDKPVFPIGYSYRKPSWIRKKIFKQPAKITINIGEPIYPNKEILNMTAREEDLTKRVHARVCELAGINPKDNIYPPIYNNSKRIDYYTKEYGVGYKGSW